MAVAAVVSFQNQGSGNGYATLSPAGGVPVVSSVNAAVGESVAGFATSGLTAGTASVFGSQAGVIGVDVVGFYIQTMVPILPVVSGEPVGYGWDAAGRLVSTTAVDNTVTSFSYGADGARVSARTGGEIVFYLGGVEATRNGSGWVRVRRSYGYGGVVVASRTIEGSTNTVSWLLGNHQGSLTTTVTAGVATSRAYQPYGAPRGPAPGAKPTTTGFLGQHEDPTGLAFLNNRYYDPTVGVFLSVDPLVATTGEPYTYASASPVTLSDPNGLCAGREGARGGCGIDYYGGGNNEGNPGFEHDPGSGNLGRFTGPFYCGQTRQGLFGGTCNTYGGTTAGERLDWHDGTRIISATACGAPCKWMLTLPLPPAPLPGPEDSLRLFSDVLTGCHKGADGAGLGLCAAADGGSASAAVSAQLCAFGDENGLSVLGSVGAGVAYGAGASISAGGLISNANAENLSGWSICGSVGAGIATGTLCGSLAYQAQSKQWDYNGAWSLYGGLSTPDSTPAGFTYNYTWVTSVFSWGTAWDFLVSGAT